MLFIYSPFTEELFLHFICGLNVFAFQVFWTRNCQSVLFVTVYTK